MNNIELNHIDLNSIGLDSKQISGISKSYKREVKPYIKGHVIDSASSVTIVINGNTNIDVPVDSNGNWKWKVDRTITNLNYAFSDLSNLQSLTLCGLNSLTDLRYMIVDYRTSPRPYCANLEIITFKKCDLSNVKYFSYFGATCTKLEKINGIKSLSPNENGGICGAFLTNTKINYMPPSFFKNIVKIGDGLYGTQIKECDISQAELTYFRNTFNNSSLETLVMGNVANGMEFSGTPFGSNLKNLSFAEGKTIKGDFPISSTSKLTEQSVVNIFNAVAADDITLTFHQNVWNMIMREIDIQGSPIQVAYQNMIDNYDVTIANASFDAEIEYIEGDGTQWLNTDTKFKVGTSFYVKFEELEIPETPTPQNRTHIFGVHEGSNRYRLRRLETDRLYYLYGNDGLYWEPEMGVMKNNIIEFTYTKDLFICTYNENTTKTTTPTSATQIATDNKITAFYHQSSGDSNMFIGRFYAIKIWEDNALVRDMIPVRKGTTGYMYDKVSGNLFGNSGTGDFILGNDK